MKKYRTIVADPPWPVEWKASLSVPTNRAKGRQFVRPLPYSTMPLDDILALPVSDLADDAAHLYLWTTNQFLEDAYGISRSWGFVPAKLLVWCKEPMGVWQGGVFTQTTEFILWSKRGQLKAAAKVDSTWWKWTRTKHSRKPEAFLDLVEQVSPGPYLELFARRQRLGWDTWGNECRCDVEMVT